MAEIEKKGDEVVYRQDDGEITAWLTDFEEKMALRHEGSRFYKTILYVLVGAGLVYLGAIFYFPWGA